MPGNAMCPCTACFDAPPRASPPRYHPSVSGPAAAEQLTKPSKVYHKSSGGVFSGILKRTVSVASTSSDLVKLRSSAQPPAYNS